MVASEDIFPFHYTCSTANVTRCLELLARFIDSGELTQLLLKQTSAADSNSEEAAFLSPQQQLILQFIAKLPDLAANRIHGLDPFFSPRVYFSHVMGCLVGVLEAISAGGAHGRGALQFAAHLVGKLVTIEQAGVLCRWGHHRHQCEVMLTPFLLVSRCYCVLLPVSTEGGLQGQESAS